MKLVSVQPHPANFLFNSSLSSCVPSKLLKLQSSISLFSLPRIYFKIGPEEPLSALANIGAEIRSKSGLADRTTSLAVEGLSSRRRSRPLATYWTSYFLARNCLSLVSNVAKEIKFSSPSGLIMILFV